MSARKQWSESEDALLLSLVSQYEQPNWQEISAQIPGRNLQGCLQRYQNFLAPSVKNGPWSPSEDEILFSSIFSLSDENLTQISSKLPGRKQRFVKKRLMHFKNILSLQLFGTEVKEHKEVKEKKEETKKKRKVKEFVKSEVKEEREIKSEGWSKEEEKKLVDLYGLFGDKWEAIAKCLAKEKTEVERKMEEMLRWTKNMVGEERKVGEGKRGMKDLLYLVPRLKELMEESKGREFGEVQSKRMDSREEQYRCLKRNVRQDLDDEEASKSGSVAHNPNKFKWKGIKKEKISSESDSDTDSRASWIK